MFLWTLLKALKFLQITCNTFKDLRILQKISEYFRRSQNTSEDLRVLQKISEYFRVLQNDIKDFLYRVFEVYRVDKL